MKNWTIGRKIKLAFGAMVALIILLGTVGFFALRTAASGFADYRALARDTNLSGRLQANMLTARMHVKDYIITGSPESKDGFEQRWQTMGQFMADAKREIVHPERAAMLDRAASGLEDYRAGFDRVVEFKRRRTILYGVLAQQGSAALDALSTAYHKAVEAGDNDAALPLGAMTESLLRARLGVMKFLETNVPADAEVVARELGTLAKALNAADSPALAPVRKSTDAYREAFEEMTIVIRQRNDVIANTLDRLGPQFAEQIEEVKLSIKADQDELGPRLAASNNTALTFTLAISVAASVVGAVLAVLISRGIVAALRSLVERLASGSREVTATAGHVSSSSQSLAEGASEQAAAIEETTSSVEEIASVVKQTSQNARSASEMSEQNAASTREARDLSQQALTVARDGDQAVTRMSEAITEIKASSEQTAKIIKGIDEIAFQTNLLALNAAVEAARAGEAGKGFAVVAEEVRTLAQRSAEAAKDTADMIGESLKKAGTGVSVSEEVKEAFEKITGTIEKVATHVTEIAAAGEQQAQVINDVSDASEQQAQGLEQINTGVAQMDQVTQANASSAEEMASSAEELTRQAIDLDEMVNDLRAMIERNGATTVPTGDGPRGYRADPGRRDASAAAMRRPTTSSAPGSGKTKGGKAKTHRDETAASSASDASVGASTHAPGASASAPDDPESQLPLESDEEALQQF